MIVGDCSEILLNIKPMEYTVSPRIANSMPPKKWNNYQDPTNQHHSRSIRWTSPTSVNSRWTYKTFADIVLIFDELWIFVHTNVCISTPHLLLHTHDSRRSQMWLNFSLYIHSILNSTLQWFYPNSGLSYQIKKRLINCQSAFSPCVADTLCLNWLTRVQSFCPVLVLVCCPGKHLFVAVHSLLSFKDNISCVKYQLFSQLCSSWRSIWLWYWRHIFALWNWSKKQI